MVPLNISRINAAYYAGNLHKWVCAPKGTAFLWVRPDRQVNVHPMGVSHHYGEGFAREFAWQGTRDYSAWLSIPRALDFMNTFGWDQVMSHNHALAVWDPPDSLRSLERQAPQPIRRPTPRIDVYPPPPSSARPPHPIPIPATPAAPLRGTSN